MKQFVFVVLLVARAASADPVPAQKKARAHGAGSAAATTATAPTEPGQASETKWAQPELPLPDEREVLVGMKAPGAPSPSAKAGAAAKAGSTAARAPAAPAEAASRTLLASIRALKVAEGEARVTVAEGERVLRPGDRFGVDTVRTVSDGVIVLDRPAVPGRPGGAATVVVRFDAGGAPRVRILYEQDPTPAIAPRVH